MLFHSKLASSMLLAVISPLVCAAQSEPTPAEVTLQQQITANSAKLADARMEGFAAVAVNGQALSADAIKREAIYLVGAKTIDSRIADFFIKEHLEEAIANGRDKKEFDVPEAELTADVESLMAEFQKKNPGISLWEAVRAQYGMDRERYLHSRRQTILFDRVFFPGPATNWPIVTREAIMASSQGNDGKAFWDNIEKASIDEKGEPRELPAFWMQLCRGWVQKQLKTWSDIRYPSDGLPPEVCLRVNDQDWATEEAFELVRHGLFTQDIERAMTEVVVREALRQELERVGAYMSDEAFRAEFDEYRQEFDSTPFTTEVIAVNFKGYPSLEAFRQRWRLMRSFEKMIADDVNDQNLQAHADKYKAFFGNSSIILDVIQFLGRDLQTGGWLADGIEKSGERAAAAMQEIEAGASFDDVLTSKGEYYVNDKDRGRLGSKTLNVLRQTLRETEFTDVLEGFSIGYFLFFDAEPGRVYGPMRGPEGHYIARVSARVPARGPVSVQNERTRELVRQDYVNFRFREWAAKVVGDAKVE